MKFRRIVILSLAGLCSYCKTGSGYERLKSEMTKGSAVPPEKSQTLQINVGNFGHVSEASSFDSYLKGYFIPGYSGVDFESKGEFGRKNRERGYKDIYQIHNYDVLFKEYLLSRGISVDSDRVPRGKRLLKIKGNFTGTESAARFHTYGCWPFIGTLLHIFNADYITIVNETTVAYEIQDDKGHKKLGQIRVVTEESYGFYSMLGTMISDQWPAQVGATDRHLAEIHSSLLSRLAAE